MTGVPSSPGVGAWGEGTGRPDLTFLNVAARHGMVAPEAVAELMREAVKHSISPAALVVERGLMDPVQVEMVETLTQPDEAIPGYEILGVLGRGGMGVVYRARQKNLDRTVALKTILVSQLAQPGMAARFEREAITSGQLRHPNIVAAYDFGRCRGRLYFAMELVEGEELGTLIERRGKLSEATAWGLARQVASGLAHAAKAGVVHRDVKPANVLLVTPPEGFPLPVGMPMVKIADFGLAFLARDTEVSDRLTVAGNTLGTPRYMAPEQLEGSDVDGRADIYALGATVYHMLCGVPPFNDRTLQAVITRKLKGEPPRVSDLVATVSPRSVELVAQMMARDPAHRVPDYSELLRRIDQVAASASCDHEPLMETSELPTVQEPCATEIMPVAGSSSQGPSPRSSWLWPAVMGGLPLVMVAIGWLFMRQWQHESIPDTSVTYSPGVWNAYLFDGSSLSGWSIVNGQWSLDVDDEGGRILAGNGVASRTIRREPPLDDYRVTLAVALKDASAVELQFAFTPTGNGGVARSFLRLERGKAIVGRRDADGGRIEPTASPVLIQASPEVEGETIRHELRVERHGTSWRAFVDARPVGVLPVPHGREMPELRLATEGGVAWFDTIEVMEMKPPRASER